MAKHYETRLVDDLDGGPADETVDFGIDGKRLEADLSAANAEKLRAALAPFVAVARRASPSTRPASASRRGSAGTDRELNRSIREWAAKRGMKIAERGRIAREVLDAYEQEAA